MSLIELVMLVLIVNTVFVYSNIFIFFHTLYCAYELIRYDIGSIFLDNSYYVNYNEFFLHVIM